MWLKKCKKAIVSRIFPRENSSLNLENQYMMSEEEILAEEEKIACETQKFKVDNVIFDKLTYLEQYIKIFSLTFLEEYEKYLFEIQRLRRYYEKELEEYKKGISGNITFSIDPEQESKMYMSVIDLENKIENFVEYEVNYKTCKDKFSKLCYKLNVFYNALINTDVETEKIINQLKSASNSLTNTINEAKTLRFFERDSRKKEEILRYVIYSEYIMFKSYFRCSVIENFEEYKTNISEFHTHFINEEYDRLVFKFLIEELEKMQNFITSNLNDDSSYKYVLESCQKLQDELDDYAQIFNDNNYFEKLIKFENTMDNLLKSKNTNYCFDISDTLDFNHISNDVISINSIAIAILRLLNNKKAELLLTIINSFKVEISWREFYFLCKIFELYENVIKKSSDTIFSIIKYKFLKLDEKYEEYSSEYIEKEKQKILSYNGEKAKKYILLLTAEESDISEISNLLKEMSLDFAIVGTQIYLNHSYFNGFKNLEQNFGSYITF